MPTNQPRLNVTLDAKTDAALSLLAEIENKSKSSVAFALLQEALEQQEDIYLSEIANKRDNKNTKWVDYSVDVWQ